MKRVLVMTGRHGIVGILARTQAVQVVACVGLRGSLPSAARQLAPDVVLIDQCEAPTGLVLARLGEAEELLGGVKRVLLTGRMDAAWLNAAFAAGADAVISSEVRPAHLGIVLVELAADHLGQPQRSGVRAPIPETSLSPRELEILRLVARGMSNRQVAMRLCVVEQTVKFHLCNTYRKLGVANRTEATHYAHRHGLFRAARHPATPH